MNTPSSPTILSWAGTRVARGAYPDENLIPWGGAPRLRRTVDLTTHRARRQMTWLLPRCDRHPMKLIISLLLALACAGVARAQDTTEFTVFLSGANVVPPSATPETGEGTFSLFGNDLSYDILTLDLFYWRPQVYGPAEPGFNGSPLFRLTTFDCELPVPGGSGGFCRYKGTHTISDQQITELTAGLWYVQMDNLLFPEHAIRGQVVPVPEPANLLLFTLLFCFGTLVLSRSFARTIVPG